MRLSFGSDTSLNHRFLRGDDILLTWGVFGSAVYHHYPRNYGMTRVEERPSKMTVNNVKRASASFETFWDGKQKVFCYNVRPK